jgi:magnesium-transporting ATPase (P-type)
MRLEILTTPTIEQLDFELDRICKQYKNINKKDISDIEKFRNENLGPGQRLSMVIDGPTLAFVLASDVLSKKFFRLGLLASSVVCCRVSPK